MRFFEIDTKGFLGGFKIEPLLDIAKVVTERRLFALDTDIIGVQASGLVGTSQRYVADLKGNGINEWGDLVDVTTGPVSRLTINAVWQANSSMVESPWLHL